MKERSQAWYLAEIVESAKIIQEEIEGLSQETFLKSQTACDAVCFRFIAIGHAVSQINEETRGKLADIPFEKMRGMRNVLAHDYTAMVLENEWAKLQRDTGAGTEGNS